MSLGLSISFVRQTEGKQRMFVFRVPIYVNGTFEVKSDAEIGQYFFYRSEPIFLQKIVKRFSRTRKLFLKKAIEALNL
jgi:hypothetical protein